MQAKEITAKVEEMVMPVAEKRNYEIVDVEYVKEGPNKYLRIYADKEGGFSVDDCEILSRDIEKMLDSEDFIENAYILEVSSPGIDRILKKDKEYVKYKGRTVDVKLYKALDGQKEFQGELVGLEDGKIKITTDGEELSFEKKDVAICRLAVIL
ncbi:MAG: ribosome maturation factor RimP [Firmicutes bacterium]|nr:ribosome maturation factor RimP [Bacillota bacterium]